MVRELSRRAWQLRVQSTVLEKVREVGDARVRHERLCSTPTPPARLSRDCPGAIAIRGGKLEF